MTILLLPQLVVAVLDNFALVDDFDGAVATSDGTEVVLLLRRSVKLPLLDLLVGLDPLFF